MVDRRDGCRSASRDVRRAAPRRGDPRGRRRAAGAAWTWVTTTAARSPVRRHHGSTPGRDRDRPQPRHASRADSNIRTDSSDEASRNPTVNPAVAIERTSATSSTVWCPTGPNPPAATRVVATEHHALAVARSDDGPAHPMARPAPAASSRAPDATSAAARSDTRSDRPPWRGRDRPPRSAPPGPSAGAGSGRVSASNVTIQSPVAASRPCCKAHALPTHPAGSGRPTMTDALRRRRQFRRGVGRLVVDDEHLGHTWSSDDGLEERLDAWTPRRGQERGR